MGQLLLKRFAMADGSLSGVSAVTGDPPGRPAAPLRVLDLGCGMGFTGMMAALLGHAVLFADLEPPALLFARLNAIRWSTRIRTRQLNWQTARLDETFDLILGADILYERNQWEFLEPFWRAHLSPAGSILLGEPGRQTGDDFPTWIAVRGLGDPLPRGAGRDTLPPDPTIRAEKTQIIYDISHIKYIQHPCLQRVIAVAGRPEFPPNPSTPRLTPIIRHEDAKTRRRHE